MPSYRGMNDVMTTFEKHGIKPNIRFELFDDWGIMSMVGQHVGVSIMPKLVLSQLPQNVRVIPLKQESFRTIGIATKQTLSPAAKKFVEVLKQWLEENEENLTDKEKL